MRSKAGWLMVVATVISTLILGGIYFGLRSDVERVKSRLDVDFLVYEQAAAECHADLGACRKAEHLGTEVDQDLTAVEEAVRQARLFLRLTIAVPAVFVFAIILRTGLQRRSLSKQHRTSAAFVPDVSAELQPSGASSSSLPPNPGAAGISVAAKWMGWLTFLIAGGWWGLLLLEEIPKSGPSHHLAEIALMTSAITTAVFIVPTIILTRMARSRGGVGLWRWFNWLVLTAVSVTMVCTVFYSGIV